VECPLNISVWFAAEASHLRGCTEAISALCHANGMKPADVVFFIISKYNCKKTYNRNNITMRIGITLITWRVVVMLARVDNMARCCVMRVHPLGNDKNLILVNLSYRKSVIEFLFISN
jgi:hypothetical protein